MAKIEITNTQTKDRERIQTHTFDFEILKDNLNGVVTYRAAVFFTTGRARRYMLAGQSFPETMYADMARQKAKQWIRTQAELLSGELAEIENKVRFML